MSRIFLIAGALFSLLSMSAEAATVTTDRILVEEEGVQYYVLKVRFEANPGEANDLTVTHTQQEVVFEDASVAIDETGECRNADPNRVVCSPTDASLDLRPVRLGDRRDRARIETDAASIRVGGGPGNDDLYGGGGTDYLFGGPGDDLVDGGGSGDVIDGGGGRDELRAGEPENAFATDIIRDGDRDRSADNDVIVGYPSRTFVSYGHRRKSITIDLEAGTAGAPGEHDSLVGITQIEAGKAGDTLIGSQVGEFLVGAAGNDVIRGRGGDDRLRGQLGADRVYGGNGDDIADDDSDDAVDFHKCGPGADFVSSSDKRDRLRRSCEDGAWSSSPDLLEPNRMTAQPAVVRERAVFRSTCREWDGCSGRIKLVTRETRELLGRGRFKFRGYHGNNPEEARRHDMVVHLTARGLEKLDRGGYIRVVIVSQPDCGGCLNPPPLAKTGFTTWMRPGAARGV